MRKSLFIIVLGLISTLTACNQFKEYSVSEDTVNRYLEKRVNFNKNIGVSGILQAEINFVNLSSKIGREDPAKLSVSGQSKVKITSLLGNTEAELTITLIARPEYDAKNGAIYLKDVSIKAYSISPKQMTSTVDKLMPLVDTALTNYFENQPVYVLDPEKNKTEAAAKKLAKNLSVQPGKLVISL